MNKLAENYSGKVASNVRSSAFRIMGITLLVIALDQWSKYLAVSLLTIGVRIKILPGFFDLTLTFNKGVAFGLFAGISNDALRYTILGITTLIALSAIVYFFIKELSGSVSGQIAFAMIIGGALGNQIDRIRLGQVVDFFLAYYDRYHWPVFNVADSCISIGVVILLLFHSREKKTG